MKLIGVAWIAVGVLACGGPQSGPVDRNGNFDHSKEVRRTISNLHLEVKGFSCEDPNQDYGRCVVRFEDHNEVWKCGDGSCSPEGTTRLLAR